MSDLEKDILSLLHSKGVDQTAEYVARGRRFQRLNDKDLIEAWKSALRAMAKKPRDYEVRSTEEDLRSELAYRNLDLPFDDDVKGAFEEFIQHVDKHVAERKRDPDAHTQANEDLLREIERYKVDRDRSS